MQTKPPKSNYIDFLNWEEFIGAKDGISNLVKRNVTCIPNEWNTFFVTSIKINGCKYSSISFEMNGYFLNKEYIPSELSGSMKSIDDNKYVSCDLSKDSIKLL